MKNLVIVIAFIFICIGLFGQSNITLMDLSVSPYYPDSVNTTYPNQEMGIVFKMNQSPLAQQVHVLIGTAANQSNLDLFTANVIENNGLYYISYNGVEESTLPSESFVEFSFRKHKVHINWIMRIQT